MYSTAIVVFREIFEVALILGVILASTRGLAHRTRWILAGIGGGVLGALIVAYFAQTISMAAEGLGQELFNAGILLTAAAVISWTALWMRQHGRELTQRLRQMGQALLEGQTPLYTMALVIALAVLREGAEIVLFTYGMIAAGQGIGSILAGSAIGLAGGVLAGALLYFGLLRIPTKYIFRVTTWMLILLSAGMASMAAQYLVSAGYFLNYADVMWDSSGLLPEASVLGQALHTLLGYTEQPMQIQLIFYAGTLGLLSVCMLGMDRLQGRGSHTVTPAVST